jgi:hypothetical protein
MNRGAAQAAKPRTAVVSLAGQSFGCLDREGLQRRERDLLRVPLG